MVDIVKQAMLELLEKHQFVIIITDEKNDMEYLLQNQYLKIVDEIRQAAFCSGDYTDSQRLSFVQEVFVRHHLNCSPYDSAAGPVLTPDD